MGAILQDGGRFCLRKVTVNVDPIWKLRRLNRLLRIARGRAEHYGNLEVRLRLAIIEWRRLRQRSSLYASL